MKNLTFTEAELQEAIQRAKEEISEDIAKGVVPSTVKSFSELHDYVDANEYGGAFEVEWDDSDKFCTFWNKVQDACDQWLKAERPSNQPRLKVGETVKYAKPVDASEAECSFILIEHNGDRCLIRLICEMPIPPVECVPIFEIKKA